MPALGEWAAARVRLGVALLGALSIGALAPAKAEPERARALPTRNDPQDEGELKERAALSAEQRVAFGLESVSRLTLLLSGFGADLRIAPTLTLRGMALLMIPSGTTDDGDAADFGFGGELSLRLAPWPEQRLRPYLWWGLGLMLFREPFLPGGTRYDGIISFGGGAEVSLGERLSVGAEGHVVHLSNGQGLGEHNPAYDGIGLSVTATWALAPGAELGGVWDDVSPREGGRASPVPGVSAVGAAGGADGALLAGGRLLLSQRIGRPLVAVLDVESGLLEGEGVTEAGLGLAGHLGPVTLGGHLGHRWFAGIRSLVATLQSEWHLTPEVTLAGMAHHERSSGFGNLWRAAVGLRAFPLRDLVVDLGVGFDRIGEETLDDDGSDPYLGLEWQLPLEVPRLQLSLFVERQVSTLNLVGLRASWGMGASLRDRDRHDSWRRIR